MRLRNISKLVIFNLVAVLALCILLELTVRLLVPEIRPHGTDSSLFQDSLYNDSPGLKPGATGVANGAEIIVNAYGFPQYARSVDPKRDGWLLLGDSVTMGIGVHPDSTFAGRLHTQLDSINVLNPSVIGYTASDYRNVFESLILAERAQLPIDRVTVFYCLNDIYVKGEESELPGTTIRAMLGEALDFMRLHVRSYLFLKNLLFDRAKSYYLFDKSLYVQSPELIDGAVSTLAAIHSRCLELNIRFEVVILPYEWQLRPDSDDFYPQKQIVERLAAQQIPCYDFSTKFRETADAPKALYLYGDGIHFSDAGHRIIAKFCMSALI